MTKQGEMNNLDTEELESFIDQAIDDLFVPASGDGAQEPQEAAPEAQESASEEPAPEPAAEEEEVDLEISWDQDGNEDLAGPSDDPAAEAEPEPFEAQPQATQPEAEEQLDETIELAPVEITDEEETIELEEVDFGDTSEMIELEPEEITETVELVEEAGPEDISLEAEPQDEPVEVATEEAIEVAPEPQIEEEPALQAEPEPEAAVAPEEFYDEEEGEEGPKHPELRPLYEAMLSLDWEINQENISKVEQRIQEFHTAHPGVHTDNGARMGLITCKYLRASKSLATPLAIRFLREMLSAFEVFLTGQKPGGASPDGLVNDLMGLYNEMKNDANRLRAAALQRRGDAAPAPAPTPEPAPPVQPIATEGPTTTAVASDDAIQTIKGGLGSLWDQMEQIRGRLHGAAAQGAPFAEAIDRTCEEMQKSLKQLIEVAEPLSSAQATGSGPTENMREEAREISAAMEKFQAQLQKLI